MNKSKTYIRSSLNSVYKNVNQRKGPMKSVNHPKDNVQ